LHKPLETKLLADKSGVLMAEEVAAKTMKAIKVCQSYGFIQRPRFSIALYRQKGDYNCSFGFNGFLLTTLNSGTSPTTSCFEGLGQIIMLPLCRLISLIAGWQFNRTIARVARTRDDYQD
jgi:hypothetical protein